MHPLTPQDPRVVGRYQLLASLGQAGIGHVYLAMAPDGKRVAVKLPPPHLSQDPVARQRFAWEVDAARETAGPHGVAIVDADTNGAEPWAATEFVVGPALMEVIDSAGALPEQYVRWLAVNLAKALRSIHAADLMHRNIEPAHVCLMPDGAKLLDLGLSRPSDQVPGVLAPGYLSPEQAESKVLSQKSDIFSLGSLLATAATGRAPFEGASVPQILGKVVREDPDLDNIPESLKDLIGHCLTKDPQQRPSAAELVALLEEAGEVTPESLPIVDTLTAELEAQIAALPAPPPFPTSPVQEPVTALPVNTKPGMRKGTIAIIASVAALALLLLIAIPLVILFGVFEENSSSQAGDSANRQLEVPSNLCDAMDLKGLRDFAEPDSDLRNDERHIDEGDGYLTCAARLDGGIGLSLTVRDTADSPQGEEDLRCMKDGGEDCYEVERIEFPDGESDARPWEHGGIQELGAGPMVSMIWIEGDFIAWATAQGDWGDRSSEKDFLMEQGIAIYDLMKQA